MIEMPFSLFSNVSRRHSATAIILTLASAAAASFFVFQSSLVTLAAPIACPFVDGDGGTPGIQVTVNVTIDDVDDGGGAVGDFYDCTAELVEIKTGVIVTLGSNTSTGAIAEIHFLHLTIETGATISANVQGCTEAGISDGFAPNASNICVIDTTGTSGGGQGSNSNAGAGGGGHGGAGGNGTTAGLIGGSPYDSATAPARFGASGGQAFGSSGSKADGGTGGGVVYFDVSGTFNHDGTISANGGNGTKVGTDSGGGGAGGSIYVTAATIDGTTGSFSATGGAGANGSVSRAGGGGGGGRVAVICAAGTQCPGGGSTFASGDFTMTGGEGFAATDGFTGTVYVKNTATSRVEIFHGFTFDDTDHVETTWISDLSATNQYCATGILAGATPSVTAQTITFGGTLNCTQSITSFNLTATGGAATLAFSQDASFTANAAVTMAADLDFEVGTGVTIGNTKVNADLIFNIPAGDHQVWTDVIINTGAEGEFLIDDAIDITLAGTTDIRASLTWSAVGDLTIASTASISANSKGCVEASTGDGFAPNSSNICDIDGVGGGTAGGGQGSASNAGAGGGGHGGAGGNGTTAGLIGGSPYDSATAPARFGASGGQAGGVPGATGGTGGGLVRLNVSGTFIHEGTISANGGNGAVLGTDSGGGGAGGSIYITVPTMNGTTGTFSATGGAGANGSVSRAGGGGGGGRVAIVCSAGTQCPGGGSTFASGDFTMTGGEGFAATDGFTGTVYVKNTATSRVEIFHGFTFDDTDHVETTWISDPSATNQYCATGILADATPSVTAETLTFGGTLNCTQSITSFNLTATGGVATLTFSDSASFTANAAVTMDADLDFEVGTGVTIGNTKVNADLIFNIPAGDHQVWTDVIINTGAEGEFLIDDAIDITLAGTTAINASLQWTALMDLTIASTALINANGKGCIENSTGDGFAPDSSNICVIDATGAAGGGQGNNSNGSGAGGGHGGAGGNSSTGQLGGSIYDSATAPVRFGASGGQSAGTTGGTGGGLVRLEVSGTFTHDGTISANGGNGTVSGGDAAGGGAGGSIYVTTSAYGCSIVPTFSTIGGTGGNGSSHKGGGGGGGRIAIGYSSVGVGCDFDADADTIGGSGASVIAAGGADGAGSADDGSNPNPGKLGTLSLLQALQMSSAVTDDTDGDGQIDAIVVTFTEDLDGTTVDGLDFDITSSPDYAIASASETSPGVVTIVLTESGAADTDETPTVEIIGSISNASSTTTATSGSIVSTDGADPLITSISPADGTTGVSSATDVVLTFSEPMDTGTVTVTVSSEPTGRTNTFSNDDETLTISYTGTFSSGDHTVTLTAGDDPEGNTNAGAVTGITHPATFTVAASGGGGSPTPPVGSGTPAFDNVSPQAGEILQANAPIQISWTFQGRIDFVNLYYSIGGESWIEIVRNHPNSGLYDWTVPNHNTEALFLRIEGTDQTTVFVSDQEGPMSIVGATFEPPPPTEDGDVPVTVRGAQAFIRPNGCRYFATGVFFPSPKDGTLQPVSEICPGDRITTPSYRTVYLVNGLLVRHPFFNALMYRTHYADFTGVKVVTDSTLVTMDLGDLILPKPGTVLVKVPDRPETYALFPNSDDPLHHFARLVETEQAAIANFGPDWADSVIDIPPTMFDLLVLQTPILGQENIDSSTLLRREDLEDPVSPFTFASLLGQAVRIIMQAAKAVVTGW